MDFIDFDELRQAWPMLEPQSHLLIANGINNLTQMIRTPDGDYILRTYSSDRSIEHIRYELNLLRILQPANLSFQIPAPIPTVNGELFASWLDGIMTLSQRLPGSIPQGDNLQQAFTAGQALAELVEALADVQAGTKDFR